MVVICRADGSVFDNIQCLLFRGLHFKCCMSPDYNVTGGQPGVCQGSAGGLPGVCQGSAGGLPVVCRGSVQGLSGVCRESAESLPGVCQESAGSLLRF